MLNKRIKKLRNQSRHTKPSVSIERALLLTNFYKSGKADNVSKPIARALAFKHLMENKTIYINNDELIIGERGPSPKATPTYPEICTHSKEDFEIIKNRDKIQFSIDKNTRTIQEEIIIPFWKNKSIRDIIFKKMDSGWKDAYDAGVFTEFMEQRAPGHTVLDDKIYHNGFLDFKKEIKKNIKNLDYKNDPEAKNKKEELKAMEIAADALIIFAQRHGKKALELAEKEKNIIRKKELKKIADICKKVPAHKPENFWEALQYYWFVHLGVITEYNTWDSFNPGRLDQHLYPFYKKGLRDRSLTKEKAKELLQCFWIKFNNQPAPPKVGVTAEESNTYTDFCLINLGGITKDGDNAVNELSYLILDVIKEMRLLQPSSMIQISKKTPDEFLHKALNIIKTGYGQPSIFNTDEIIKELTRQGKTLIDARTGGCSGCVESGVFGKESYILTGYFNLVKILEITLHNGIDPRTKKTIGLKTGKPEEFTSFEEFYKAFEKQLKHFVDIKIKGNNIIEQLWAKNLPSPLMSILIDDCIKKGKDYNDGGAKYNTSYIQGVGIGTITDAMTAIKYHVYDNKNITIKNLIENLDNNFENNDEIRQILLDNTPKYGNDNDYADSVLKKIFNSYFKAVDGKPNTKRGKYHINLLPTTVHIYFGSLVGATPDGRNAYTPLSEGISPVQGADRNGPTSVVKSASKIKQVKTGGTLLNQRFTPQILQTEEGIIKLGYLIRSYFKMDGHHIQFNIVTSDTLRKAQKKPEEYKDLIVRVAGYSDYFVNLSMDLQNEIIKRTEHITY